MPEERGLKERILDIAARMFVEYGYEGTTFQRVADELGITKGAITYHFRNKFAIMDCIIQELFDELKAYVDGYPEEYRNEYWKHCVVYICVYRKIMSTERRQELFYHRDQQHRWQGRKIDAVLDIYERIERDFHKPYSRDRLRVLVHMDMGARIRLHEIYKSGAERMTLDDYCYYHIYLLGTLCKLDEATMDENIREAFEFTRRHAPPEHRVFG